MNLGAQLQIAASNANGQDGNKGELIGFNGAVVGEPHSKEKTHGFGLPTAFGVRGDHGGVGGDVGRREEVEDSTGVGEGAKPSVHGNEGIGKKGVHVLVLSLCNDRVDGFSEADFIAEPEETAIAVEECVGIVGGG